MADVNETTDATGENAASETNQTPDIGEQLTALHEEVRQLREAQNPQEAEQPAGDLYDQFVGLVPGEAEGEVDGRQALEGAETGEAGQPDPFEEIVRERVAEANAQLLYPVLAQLQADRDRQAFEKLAERHPELHDEEMQMAIADRLEPLAERYGLERLMFDPEMVELALLYEKAARATANAQPPEQVANQGAKLETNAGAASGAGQQSPEEAIKQGILSARSGGDVFT